MNNTIVNGPGAGASAMTNLALGASDVVVGNKFSVVTGGGYINQIGLPSLTNVSAIRMFDVTTPAAESMFVLVDLSGVSDGDAGYDLVDSLYWVNLFNDADGTAPQLETSHDYAVLITYVDNAGAGGYWALGSMTSNDADYTLDTSFFYNKADTGDTWSSPTEVIAGTLGWFFGMTLMTTTYSGNATENVTTSVFSVGNQALASIDVDTWWSSNVNATTHAAYMVSNTAGYTVSSDGSFLYIDSAPAADGTLSGVSMTISYKLGGTGTSVYDNTQSVDLAVTVQEDFSTPVTAYYTPLDSITATFNDLTVDSGIANLTVTNGTLGGYADTAVMSVTGDLVVSTDSTFDTNNKNLTVDGALTVEDNAAMTMGRGAMSMAAGGSMVLSHGTTRPKSIAATRAQRSLIQSSASTRSNISCLRAQGMTSYLQGGTLRLYDNRPTVSKFGLPAV